jgi:glycosyltransferase involved in cell wall biosynthesis
MPKSLISIIIPIYKVEPYLRQCIDSIIHQTYTNLEIILVDDGSPDSCPKICDEYAKKDNRIIVVHKKNGGLSDARNAGLDICSGAYIYFLDGDDFIENNTISVLCQYLEMKKNFGIAIGYFTTFCDGVNTPYKKDWLFSQPRLIGSTEFAERMLMEKSNFASTAKLYKRELFENLRFQKDKKNEDTLFIADLAQIIERKKFDSIDVPIYSYYYRIHAQSISHDEKDPLEKHVISNYDSVIEKFKSKTNLVKFLRNKQFDLTIDLQTKYLKTGESAAYIDNIKNVKKIPLFHILKKMDFKYLLYFIILKYMPQIFLKFKSK